MYGLGVNLCSDLSDCVRVAGTFEKQSLHCWPANGKGFAGIYENVKIVNPTAKFAPLHLGHLL